jgi:drug/metabolite transporter (DMT)-like permease
MLQSSKLSWRVVLLILLLLVLDTAAQIFFKIGVTRLGEFPVENGYVIAKYTLQLLSNPFVVGGIIALIFAFFTWLILISKVDLSFAHPMTSLVYVTIPLCSSWLLNEPFNWKQLIGIALIVLGVIVISEVDTHITHHES